MKITLSCQSCHKSGYFVVKILGEYTRKFAFFQINLLSRGLIFQPNEDYCMSYECMYFDQSIEFGNNYAG